MTHKRIARTKFCWKSVSFLHYFYRILQTPCHYNICSLSQFNVLYVNAFRAFAFLTLHRPGSFCLLSSETVTRRLTRQFTHVYLFLIKTPSEIFSVVRIHSRKPQRYFKDLIKIYDRVVQIILPSICCL